MDNEHQNNIENVGEISEPVTENKNENSAAEENDTVDVIGNGQLIKKVLNFQFEVIRRELLIRFICRDYALAMNHNNHIAATFVK